MLDRDAERSLVFRAGGRVYACQVVAVREVVPLQAVMRLPGAPDGVLGLINNRGTLVTVLDAGALLHGSAPDSRQPAMLLLVDIGPRGVGLAVDRVADVRALRTDEGYTELDVRELCARVIAFTEEEE